MKEDIYKKYSKNNYQAAKNQLAIYIAIVIIFLTGVVINSCYFGDEEENAPPPTWKQAMETRIKSPRKMSVITDSIDKAEAL